MPLLEKWWPELWRQGVAAALLALALYGNFTQLWVWGTNFKQEQENHKQCRQSFDVSQNKVFKLREIANDAVGRIERQAAWRKRQAQQGRSILPWRAIQIAEEAEAEARRWRERMRELDK